MSNLAGSLTASAGYWPDRAAIRLDDMAMSYAALEGATARVAGLLAAKNVGAGDRVAVMVPNVPHFVTLLYGALRRGAIVVPLGPLLAERDIAGELEREQVKLLFAWHARGEAAHRCTDATGAECELVEPGAFEALLARVPARPDVEPRSDLDPAILLGDPRRSGRLARTVLTHGRLDAAAQAAARRTGKTPEWVTLSMLPPWHPAALTWAVDATLRSGGLLTLPARPDVRHALTVIARDRVRTVVASSDLIAAMLREAGRTFASPPCLARCVCGGPLPPRAVVGAFEAVFGCPVIAAGAAGAVAEPPGPAGGRPPALNVVGAPASS